MSTNLPDRTGAGGIEDSATTVGQQKSNLGNLRDFIADLFGTVTSALATVWTAFRLHAPTTLHNGSLTFSVGSSALTINLKTRAGATPSATDPVLIGQRSATAGNGDFNLRAVTAATSLVVSSGSTLGLGNADSTPIYVYALDNAGTIELAVSQAWLGPSGIVTTTAEGGAGAADSASGVYSTSARTSVPFRALAKLAVPQTTAGTYAAVPTSCQLWPFDPPTTSASQAEMEADASTSVFASPGRLKYHPGVAKAWGLITHPTTVTVSYPAAGVSNTNPGTGQYVVTHGLTMSSANYAVLLTSLHSAFAAPRVVSRTTTTFTIQIEDAAGGATNPTAFSYQIFGDL